MRYLPLWLVQRLVRDRAGREALWSYLNPYGIDTEEQFFVMAHASWLTSRVLHARRGGTLGRLEVLTAAGGSPGPRLGDVAEKLATRSLPQVPAS
jgi:hypothetical protein